MAKQNKNLNQPKKPQTTTTYNKGTQVDNGNSAPSGWLQIAIALLVTLVCYWPSVSNEFVNWDDDPNIVENPNVMHAGKNEAFSTTFSNIFSLEKGNVIGNYNPLPILTFAMEKRATDADFKDKVSFAKFVRTVHTNNLILHLLVVFFAMRVLMLLGIGPWGALLGGLLMGIHPMRVESVAWATERKDVLFGAFFFASLECYIRYRKALTSSRASLFFILSMVLAVFSLYSKVQAVTLVVSMFVVDYWMRRAWSMRIIVEKIPLLLASLAMGLANIYTLKVQGSTNDDITGFNIIDRACIATWSFSVYLFKLFIPEPMSPLYPYPKPLQWFVYASPVIFLAVAAAVYWLWKNDRRVWVFGFLFFFLNVAPVLQFFGAGQGYLADRFTYVPYFGFFAIAAWLYDKYREDASKSLYLNLGFGVALAAFMFLTVRQVGVWKNGDTLWSHVMKYEFDKAKNKPTSALPYWNRGQYLRKKGEVARALADYTTAVTVDSDNPELYNSRGKTYFDLAASGRREDPKTAENLQKALSDYNKSIELSEKKPKTQSEALINRGAAKGMAGQFEAALEDLNKGVALDPTNKNGYFNRSIVYYNLNNYDQAINDYSEYLKLEPYDANMLYERGMLRRVKSQFDDSKADLDKAIQIKPDFGLAYLERARVQGLSGNKAGAQIDYQRAAQYGQPMQEMDRQIMAK
jgi:tetratricopeptide (TPR) repeat protein